MRERFENLSPDGKMIVVLAPLFVVIVLLWCVTVDLGDASASEPVSGTVVELRHVPAGVTSRGTNHIGGMVVPRLSAHAESWEVTVESCSNGACERRTTTVDRDEFDALSEGDLYVID